MNLKTSPPITVLFRGTFEDTAVLVGLSQTRANVGIIAFTGELTSRTKKYCEHLSQWLIEKGLPPISIKPKLTQQEIDQTLFDPLASWGWGKEECLAAINLAGIAPLLHLRVTD